MPYFEGAVDAYVHEVWTTATRSQIPNISNKVRRTRSISLYGSSSNLGQRLQAVADGRHIGDALKSHHVCRKTADMRGS